MLSLLTAVMWLRNPAQLEQTHSTHRQLVDFISQAPEPPDEIEIGGKITKLDKSSWPAYRDATDDDIKRMWLYEVGAAAWLAELLMKIRWSIVAADKPSFITSDNPVIFLHPSLRFRGVKNADTSIIFPLSPTRLLHLDNRHSEPDHQYYPLKGTAGGFNGLIWRSALNLMFSSRPPEEVTKEMCDDAEQMGFRRLHRQRGASASGPCAAGVHGAVSRRERRRRGDQPLDRSL